MQWRGRRQSTNIEDRGRGGGGLMLAGGGGGLGIIVLLLYLFMGGDPSAMMGPGGSGVMLDNGQQRELTPAEKEIREFVATVLADTEDVWHEQFRRMGRTYREPTLVFFTGRVQSACGGASAASGPFYCPEDEKIYLDISFFEELRRRFGAPGDFAQAYVIAHEVAHHVQKQLGLTDRVHSQHGRVSQEEFNALSVRLELQADFLAGLWAHHAQRTKKILESGDIEEALRAAAAIGDDRIQRQAQGYVVPDSFTHGTSEQRVRWFRKGFETGDISQSDTFGVPDL